MRKYYTRKTASGKIPCENKRDKAHMIIFFFLIKIVKIFRKGQFYFHVLVFYS